jgi:hypothetical protein
MDAAFLRPLRAGSVRFSTEGKKNLISDLLLRYFLRALTSLRMPAKSKILNKNQKLGNQGIAQGFGALLQKKSLKDVTDEQLVHR